MTGAETIDRTSGKGHRDENFPVASILLKPEHRGPIMAFYRFARSADDVADNALSSPDDKFARLDKMRLTLTGQSDTDPHARALREALVQRGLECDHALDLLEAFRRDVIKRRYASWEELIDYCRYSAMPVGRFVLDVHGEDRSNWHASDALCAALQVINHLQDCAKDRHELDRVYLPMDALSAEGADVMDLDAPASSPALRRVIIGLANRTDDLLRQARPFAARISDRRLGIEVAVIHRLAESLVDKLRTRDPLCDKVHHSSATTLALSVSAAIGRIGGWR